MATKTFKAQTDQGGHKVRGYVVEGTPFVVHRRLWSKGRSAPWDFSQASDGRRINKEGYESRKEAERIAMALWRLASGALREYITNPTEKVPRFSLADRILLSALGITVWSKRLRDRVAALPKMPRME